MKRKPFAERPYRRGVGIMLFNAEGKVFVGRRRDAPGNAWQMPQGGIDRGEKARRAALRELAEETGTDKAEVIAKSKRWLKYDLPREIADRVWRGTYRGQKQRWFALRFRGRDDDIDLVAHRHPEFEDWRWESIDALADLAIPFKRRLYEKLVDEFRHLAGKKRKKR